MVKYDRDKMIQAFIDAAGVPGRVGVFHGTDANGDLKIDAATARSLFTELRDYRFIHRVLDGMVKQSGLGGVRDE